MNKVMVTYAGGRLAVGLSRALRGAPDPYYLIGVDTSEFQLQRAVTDEEHLVLRANDDLYLPLLQDLVQETGAEVLWVNHEAEITVISKAARSLNAATFLPSHEVVALCQDKMASHQRFLQAGVPVPASMLVRTEADLRAAFESLGDSLWIRSIQGTGGKGSLPVSDYETGRRWIDLHQGWGYFMAARRLSDRTITWESLWREGELIAAQGRRRFYWEFANLTPSGVTGIGGAHQWVADAVVDEMASRAIRAIALEPHGIFSVDMTYDWDGTPNVTEINCGRFMSGGVIHAHNQGFNFPHVATLIALDRSLSFDTPVLNPLPGDMALVHGMDVTPVQVSIHRIEGYLKELERRKAEVLSRLGAPSATLEGIT